MKRRTAFFFGFAVAWALTVTPSHAVSQTPTGPDDEASESATDQGRVAIALGVQGDRQRAFGFTSAVSYDLLRATTLRASGHGAESRGDLTQGYSGTIDSLGASFGVTQRFGRAGVDLDVGHLQISNFLKADELKIGGTFHVGVLSGGLRTGVRKSTFAPFSGLTTLDLGNGPQLVPVQARCEVRNTWWGVDGRYQGRVWGAHAGLTKEQYQDASCGLLPAEGARVSASFANAQFAQLAIGPLGRLQQLVLPVIGDQQTLANSLASAGVSWRHRDMILAVDYLRQRDHYVGTLGKAYVATCTADLGHGTEVDVSLGDSRGDGAGPRGLFGGLGLRTRF